MAVEVCAEHCNIKDHIKESTKIRDQQVENTTKIHNFEAWIQKLENKLDAVIWKVAGSVIAINMASIIIGKVWN